MSFHDIKALREQRVKLVADARALGDIVGDAEKTAKFNEMMDAADALAAKIANEERLYDAERSLEDVRERRAGREDTRAEAETRSDVTYDTAFRSYVIGGREALSGEELRALGRGFQANETRAQSVGTTTAGGYLVPQGFQAELEKTMKAYGGVESVARVVTTSTGADIPWPTMNDTGNVGALLSENTQVSAGDLTFGSVTLKCYTYSSNLVLVSLQLLQDDAIGIEGVIGSALGERLGRIANTHFTTGTGSSQPQGVVTGASTGVTAAGATAIAYDDFVNLYHSLDPAYRANAHYMFNDSTLAAAKKLKDSQGRPLWVPGLAVREPDTILDAPYTINQDMASIATGNVTALFGDFSKYIIRRAKDVTMIRMNERYADYLQVGFVAFNRQSGHVINSAAIKKLTQA